MSPLSSLGLFELDVVALDALRRLDISTTNHFVALAHTIPSPPHPLAPPPQAVCAILENLKHRVVSNPCTGLELCKDMEANPSFYSLGCSRLDQMLAGGVRVGEVLELAGPSSSGKTQICMSAVAAVAARGGQAFFLDTAQAFSARRLHDILAYMLPRSQAESAMGRVRALRLHSADSLQAALHALHQELAAYRGDAGTLVVVDSVAACLAPLLGARPPSPPPQERAPSSICKAASTEEFGAGLCSQVGSICISTGRATW
mmetsp:Transcript_584/g.1035  ORF Transcript_584/g.1035 Transcript_584/m.1035 type:complete len:260 (-) Transcript_584:1205-1984(-)